MSKVNVLITGANGQLGNEIRLVSAGSKSDTYIFTDVQELDITDVDAIRARMKEQQIHVVVNCAAYTAVEQAEEDECRADQLNRAAVLNLATVCCETGAFFIHISTDYVFSGSGNLPYRENEPPAPLGVYGRTKLAGEKAIEDSGCRYLIFRTAWLYSSFGNNFVKTILRLSLERKELPVVFDQVGTPTYAADLAGLIYHLLETRKYEDHTGIYHFSNEGVCSWFDFAHEIVSLSGGTCRLEPCLSARFPSKVKRPAFSVLDKSRVKSDFCYSIPYWRDSLIFCLEKLKIK